MEAKEYFELRTELIENSIDEDGVFSEETFLYRVLPDLMEVKMIDSEDINYTYLKTSHEGNKIKINGYTLNDSGERLQVFLINENATGLDLTEDNLMVSLKDDYQSVFMEGTRFIKSAIKRHLELHDSDTAGFIVNKLGSSEFIDSIDVIEIFLISPTITVETRGAIPTPKKLTFAEEEMKTSLTINGKSKSKEILIFKRLIDLNFLYDISVSKGAKYALEVNFNEIFDKKIEVLKAADEDNFESYLCVLPAVGIADLYKRYSTRLLEKNVRSFLNFRVEANSEMRKTIRKEPERFIAYNNGLTITANNRKIINENGKLYLETLTDFQIVNGGQTTASIYFSKKDGLDISKINLMAKINIAKGLTDEDLNELISNISLYSNTQSKVSKVDLKSRNPQIDKIKALSNSIVTSEGHKWFFEKARGEFSTMVRLAGGNKKRVEKEFPRQRRLTKVELGKYYTSWGDTPWLVKKGGEKVFRSFIDKISGEDQSKKQLNIDRDFYESLIAKTILFRNLETIHGTRGNAIGQLRSAVVPYSISVLYHMFGGTEKRQANFDLHSLWKYQELQDDLKSFMIELMKLLYDLIRKYATSDDLGENTKKEELWNKIKKSPEIKSFISTKNARKILEKYTSGDNQRKIYPEVDFSHIQMSVDLLSKGKNFYSEIQNRILEYNNVDEYKPKTYELYLENMFPKKGELKEMSKIQIDFFNKLFKNIKENTPHLLNNLNTHDEPNELKVTLDKVIKKYNHVISENLNMQSEFKKTSEIAAHKGIKFSSSISQIGNFLAEGKVPTLQLLKLSSNYFFNEKVKLDSVNEDTEIHKTYPRNSPIKNTTPAQLSKHLQQEVTFEDSLLDSTFWFDLAKWAKNNNILDGRSRAFAFNMGKYIENEYLLTEKQLAYAKACFTEACIHGYTQQKNSQEQIENNKESEDFYLKLITPQDISRTPSISTTAAETFFKLNLDHGESIELHFSFNEQKFDIEINKRNTRNEYRFFINRVRTLIGYDTDDILIISKINDIYGIELLQKPNVYDPQSEYSLKLEKLNGSTHVLINS